MTMRHVFVVILAVLAIVVLATAGAHAQAVTQPLLSSPLFNIEVLTSADAYASGDIDTLYAVSTGNEIQAGGAEFLSLTFITTDTTRALVYVDYRVRNSSETYSTYTDSVVITKEGGYKQIPLRNSTTDNIGGGIDTELRIRVDFEDGGAGVTNGVTEPAYTLNLNYKR